MVEYLSTFFCRATRRTAKTGTDQSMTVALTWSASPLSLRLDASCAAINAPPRRSEAVSEQIIEKRSLFNMLDTKAGNFLGSDSQP